MGLQRVRHDWVTFSFTKWEYPRGFIQSPRVWPCGFSDKSSLVRKQEEKVEDMGVCGGALTATRAPAGLARQARGPIPAEQPHTRRGQPALWQELSPVAVKATATVAAWALSPEILGHRHEGVSIVHPGGRCGWAHCSQFRSFFGMRRIQASVDKPGLLLSPFLLFGSWTIQLPARVRSENAGHCVTFEFQVNDK